MKKWVWGLSAVVIVLIFVGVWILSTNEQRPVVRVPGDYPSISEALAHIKAGELLEIDARNGPYTESILIQTSDIWLRSVHGNAKLRPSLPDQPTLKIVADRVKITGFEFETGAQCLVLSGTEDAWIADNSLMKCQLAVSLDQSHNGLFENNEIREGHLGFSIRESDGNRFRTNRILDNLDIGFDLFQSKKNDVENNRISNNYIGVRLTNSHSNALMKNEIKEHELEGILLIDSSKNRMNDNTLELNYDGISLGQNADENEVSQNHSRMNTHGGITLTQAHNNTVRANNLEANEQGILLLNATHNLIEQNENRMNLESGIMLRNSSQNMIRDNRFSINDKGIALNSADENMIVDNHLTQNEIGIFATSSKGNTIQGNIAKSNKTGMEIGFSQNNLFKENSLSGHAAGILMTESEKNTFVSNTFSKNQYGINLLFSQNNVILFNAFLGNIKTAVSFINFSSKNRFAQNEIKENTWGILLASSPENAIELNTVQQNEIGLVVNRSGPNTQIKGNEFIGNHVGIQFPEFLLKENTILADSQITLEVVGSDEGYLIRDNLFDRNKDVGIVNQKDVRIFARDNWWNQLAGLEQISATDLEKLVRGQIELFVTKQKGPIFVSSEKNREQRLLGSLLKLLLEANDFSVVDMTNLGNSQSVTQALLDAVVDMAWMNTDIALQRFDLERDDLENEPRVIQEFLARKDLEEHQLTWANCAPADTSAGLAISLNQEFAITSHGLNIAKEDPKTISALSQVFQFAEITPVAAFPERFIQSSAMEDLGTRYEIDWTDIQIKQSPFEQAINELSFGEVDIALIRRSAPEIEILNLRILEDDENFFWKSNLCPVVRSEITNEFPEILPLLRALAEDLSLEQLRNLTGKVVFFGESLENVARQFLISKNLIP